MTVPFSFRASITLIASLAIALVLAIGLPFGPKEAPAARATPQTKTTTPALAAGDALIISTADGTAARGLSLEALRSLPVTRFTTSTLWTNGRHQYTGVALSDLLAALGTPAASVEAVGLGEFAAVIPAQDLQAAPGPVIAYEMDGRPLSRRGFGPLWLLYPFDSSPAFRTESVYARSVTQLNRLRLDP